MILGIFEDSKSYDLGPVNYLRHTSELITGAGCLLEKILNYSNPQINKIISLFCRNEISSLLQEKYPDITVNELPEEDHLLINSRALFSKYLIDMMINSLVTDRDFSFITDDSQVIIHISKKNIHNLNNYFKVNGNYLIDFDMLKKLDHYHAPMSTSYRMLEHSWDLVGVHKAELEKDLQNLFFDIQDIKYDVSRINKKNILIAEGCTIYPDVVLDGSKGRIIINKNVTVEPHVFIQGPVYIGEGCLLKSGTVLYGPVTIGNNSKVNGEIASSIFHAHVNKQHFGFVGHSYICEWVNMGAGTTTSNLKNNYSEIAMSYGDGDFKTGSNFLGSIIGDHTKTGINTILNTGSQVGISCNLFGSSFHNKIIRSFSWDNADNKFSQKYNIDKAVSTAKITMSRRNTEMKSSYELLFRELYNNIDSYKFK